MSGEVEVMRRAAAAIREDWPNDWNVFEQAVADWLEVQAAEGWTGESVAVARAYLGEAS